jgi:peptide/nickel transport system substrate-binding protein
MFKACAKKIFCLLPILLCLLPAACQGPKFPANDGQILRIGTSMRLNSTNLIGNYGYMQFAMLLTHDTLVRFDENFLPYGQLARKWESDSQGRVWTFWLKEGLTWHDGTPLSVDDVAFTFDYLLEKNIGGYSWIGTLVSRISTDGNSITFHLARPYSRFLENAAYIVRILPKHIWESIDDPHRAFGRELTVGSGPYEFERFFETANILRFVRNENYHDSLPKPEIIEFHIFSNYDTLALSLASGNVDVYYKYGSGFPFAYLRHLNDEPEITILSAPEMGVPLALGFNTRTGPASLLNVRRAISMIVDYQQINAIFFDGKGIIPTAGFVPPSIPGFAPREKLAQNLPAAHELLQEAGFVMDKRDGFFKGPDGSTLKLVMVARNDMPHQAPVIRFLQHSLRQAGVDLSIRSSDLSSWVSRVESNDFDLLLFRTTAWGMIMDAGLGTGYFDARRKGGGCIANADDEEFYFLVDNILSTTDDAKSVQLHSGVQDYYEKQLPAIALCWGVGSYPVRNNWTGYTIHQMEGGIVNRITLGSLCISQAANLQAGL